jgi:hypothetical protein
MVPEVCLNGEPGISVSLPAELAPYTEIGEVLVAEGRFSATYTYATVDWATATPAEIVAMRHVEAKQEPISDLHDLRREVIERL